MMQVRQLTTALVEAHKKECPGCHACFNVCPVHAISMKADEEGFLYPVIDEERCIHCGLCARVCQIFNQEKDSHQIPTKAYACMNRNEGERLASSSGGVFIALVRYVISRGGCVFGAAFDAHMALSHAMAEDMEGCRAFMGSKYLQSRIGRSFGEAKKQLDKGRLVLFSGTPCQIHGLKLFLRKDYENLIAVDLACHGVPSPLVFQKYLGDLAKTHHSPVVSFRFRAKSTGWQNFSSEAAFAGGSAVTTPHGDCPFMKGFLTNLYLRPSCYACGNKEGNRWCDLTLGDYWGVSGKEADMDDDKGTSVVFTHTEKGENLLKEAGPAVIMRETSGPYALSHNSAIVRSVPENRQRRDFFRDFHKEDKTLAELVAPYIPRPTVKERIKAVIPKPLKRILKQMLGKSTGGGMTKEAGWKNYHVQALFQDGEVLSLSHGESPYMRGFLSDLYLRPHCYQCQNKEGNRFSDLTLADYWGAAGREPDMDDDKGTSAVLVHTEKGRHILERLEREIVIKETDLAYVLQCNPCIQRAVSPNERRTSFWRDWRKRNGCHLSKG